MGTLLHPDLPQENVTELFAMLHDSTQLSASRPTHDKQTALHTAHNHQHPTPHVNQHHTSVNLEHNASRLVPQHTSASSQQLCIKISVKYHRRVTQEPTQCMPINIPQHTSASFQENTNTKIINTKINTQRSVSNTIKVSFSNQPDITHIIPHDR